MTAADLSVDNTRRKVEQEHVLSPHIHAFGIIVSVSASPLRGTSSHLPTPRVFGRLPFMMKFFSQIFRSPAKEETRTLHSGLRK